MTDSGAPEPTAPLEPGRQQLARSSTLVATGTMLSRITGLARVVALA